MWILSNVLTEHSTKLSVRMHLSARSHSVWHSWIVNCENSVHGIRNQTQPNHAKPKCSEDDLMHVIINEENKIKTLLPSFVGMSWMLRLDVHIMFVFFSAILMRNAIGCECGTWSDCQYDDKLVHHKRRPKKSTKRKLK